MNELQTCVSIQVGNSSPDDQEQPIKKMRNIYPDRRDCIAIKEKLMKLVNKEEYTQTLIAYIHGSCSKQFFDEKMNSILTTAEAKITHNDLIRSILFNAHFTMTPPPNIDAPQPQIPQHITNGIRPSIRTTSSYLSNAPNPISNYLNDNSNSETNIVNNFTYQKFKKSQLNPLREIKNYSAFNMRHLPSIYQLSSRVENLVSEKNISSVDINAVKIVYSELKAMIVALLKSCVIFHHHNKNSESNTYNSRSVDINSEQFDIDESDSLIDVTEVFNVIEGNQNMYSLISPSVFTKYSTLVNK